MSLMLGFVGGDADYFGADVRENGLAATGPETQETACGAGDEVGTEGTFSPI